LLIAGAPTICPKNVNKGRYKGRIQYRKEKRMKRKNEGKNGKFKKIAERGNLRAR
jgi:hypothetical protein